MPRETDLARAVEELAVAFGRDPLEGIRQLERELPGLRPGSEAIDQYLDDSGVTGDTFRAALDVKRVAGQINVIVHACGIALSLPHIIEPGEDIHSLSLGAGNTGKAFDLETDRRVAEFKFIAWRGGPETIRQNQVFKDFLKLLWDESGRRKQLFLTGTEEAIRFLRGGRKMDSVLSRSVALKQAFGARYEGRFTRVGEFYQQFEDEVEVVDLRQFVPYFIDVPPEGPREDEL